MQTHFHFNRLRSWVGASVVAGAMLAATPALAGGSGSVPADFQNTNPELIAAQCVACHGQGGNSVMGAPKINGLTQTRITSMMRGYRDGSLSGTIMPRFTKGFTDAQIDAVASKLAAN